MRTLVLTIVLVLACAVQTDAQPRSQGWPGFQFLIGEWEGEGKGTPGEGEGTFSFLPDLQNTILIRKSHTVYPAANGRPAFAHDDLMIVYRDTTLRAIYFDNEGHTIEYSVALDAEAKSATFTSAVVPNSPRYRLSYIALDENRVKITFAIAPPANPEEFRTYVEGTAKRTK